jgi:hypothetical protein
MILDLTPPWACDVPRTNLKDGKSDGRDHFNNVILVVESSHIDRVATRKRVGQIKQLDAAG